MPSSLEVRREVSPRAFDRLDRILRQARRDLVRGGEHLAPMAERVADAEGDPHHILLYARLDRRSVGVLEARLHVPMPCDLTIVQVAVARPQRRRGVAHRLVAEALAVGNERAGSLSAVHASVFRESFDAAAFWASLGFVVVEDDGGRTIMLSADPERVMRRSR